LGIGIQNEPKWASKRITREKEGTGGGRGGPGPLLSTRRAVRQTRVVGRFRGPKLFNTKNAGLFQGRQRLAGEGRGHSFSRRGAFATSVQTTSTSANPGSMPWIGGNERGSITGPQSRGAQKMRRDCKFGLKLSFFLKHGRGHPTPTGEGLLRGSPFCYALMVAVGTRWEIASLPVRLL